jgi:hypothetical protein
MDGPGISPTPVTPADIAASAGLGWFVLCLMFVSVALAIVFALAACYRQWMRKGRKQVAQPVGLGMLDLSGYFHLIGWSFLAVLLLIPSIVVLVYAFFPKWASDKITAGVERAKAAIPQRPPAPSTTPSSDD